MNNLFWIAFSLFLVMDSFGNVPLYISILQDIPPSRQYKIIFRELLIALVVMIGFNFAGEALLSFLHIGYDTVQISGGIILFLLALKMIFPTAKDSDEYNLKKIEDPFIVPLAIPLIAGPAVLASVMLFSRQEKNSFVMVLAIFLAWLASLIILILAPIFSKWLGKKGIIAIERLMGLILVFMSIEMFMNGIQKFIIMHNNGI